MMKALRETQQNIVFIFLLVAIMAMTIRALTLQPMTVLDMKEYAELHMKPVVELAERRLETHWHEGLKRKVIYE